MLEKDPYGYSPKEPGAKLDAGKSPVRRGLLEYFPRACMAVAEVSASGASKYSWRGWETVPNGVERYGDALVRHICKTAITGAVDDDYGHLHAAHEAWNALARLELILRENEKEIKQNAIKSNTGPSGSIFGGKSPQCMAQQQMGNSAGKNQPNQLSGDFYVHNNYGYSEVGPILNSNTGIAWGAGNVSGVYGGSVNRPSWMELQDAIDQWVATQKVNTCRT